jgi:hypothetical protein
MVLQSWEPMWMPCEWGVPATVPAQTVHLSWAIEQTSKFVWAESKTQLWSPPGITEFRDCWSWFRIPTLVMIVRLRNNAGPAKDGWPGVPFVPRDLYLQSMRVDDIGYFRFVLPYSWDVITLSKKGMSYCYYNTNIARADQPPIGGTTMIRPRTIRPRQVHPYFFMSQYVSSLKERGVLNAPSLIVCTPTFHSKRNRVSFQTFVARFFVCIIRSPSCPTELHQTLSY